MASTYLSLHYHLVFSTKHREKRITPDWRDRLHQYLGGTLRNMGAYPEGVGGVEDHIHILVGLKSTHCLADVLQGLKRSSSIWVQNEVGVKPFAWQEGYAAFTVSANARTAVKRYIANQEEHHHAKTFRDELIDMISRAGIEYDPAYLD
jgi:putative transposase